MSRFVYAQGAKRLPSIEYLYGRIDLNMNIIHVSHQHTCAQEYTCKIGCCRCLLLLFVWRVFGNNPLSNTRGHYTNVYI